MVDARVEPWKVTTDEIEFQMVAGAGAAGGAVFDDLAAWPVGTPLENAVGEERDLGQSREIGHHVTGVLGARVGDGF